MFIFLLSFFSLAFRSLSPCSLYLASFCSPLVHISVFFLMILRPPRSTLDLSSAPSDVYKIQREHPDELPPAAQPTSERTRLLQIEDRTTPYGIVSVSYTHLRAHETVLDIVCRLLLEKKTKKRRSRRNTPKQQQQ